MPYVAGMWPTAHPFPETLRSLGMTEYTNEIVTTNCTNEKGY
jgi:hypothetical protein